MVLQKNTIFCTCYTFIKGEENDSYNGVLSIGKPMLNNLAVVFNSGDEPAEVNETGELCLAGNQLTSGYFNNAELNQKLFFTVNYQDKNTRFYRTGDLCKLGENGNINYVGRKDFQVKIQGFRIELSEVEFHANKAIDGGNALVALALKNATGNYEIAVAFESEEFKIDGVKEYLKFQIPTYMLPSKYFFINPFPLNVNGKIDRKALTEIILKQ